MEALEIMRELRVLGIGVFVLLCIANILLLSILIKR
jgi:hypothetical protein